MLEIGVTFGLGIGLADNDGWASRCIGVSGTCRQRTFDLLARLENDGEPGVVIGAVNRALALRCQCRGLNCSGRDSRRLRGVFPVEFCAGGLGIDRHQTVLGRIIAGHGRLRKV
jgi:hypothetical protein